MTSTSGWLPRRRMSPKDPDRQTAKIPRARARMTRKRLGRGEVMNLQHFKHDASHDATPRRCPETAPSVWGERLGGTQTLPPDARARTPARARVRRGGAVDGHGRGARAGLKEGRGRAW